MKYTLLLIVLSLVIFFRFEPVVYGQGWSNKAPVITTDQQLDKLIADLDQPETRAQALTTLLEFCSMKLYQVPSLYVMVTDPKINALMDRAVPAVRAHRSSEVIAESLKSDNREMQFWGLWNWHPWDCRGDDDDCKDALTLLPLVKELAMNKDASIRSEALGKLKRSGKAGDFVSSREAVETSAYVIFHLTAVGNVSQWSARLNPRLLELLNHPDQNVRADALNLIGSNSNRAEMYRAEFDKSIFDRVIELTRSSLDSDRWSAAIALTDIKDMDAGRSLDAFLRLATDNSNEGRSRAGLALGAWADAKDVKPVIARLIHDQTPLVSYMTIIGAGPEHYKKELEQLSHCADPQVAEGATGVLKRLAQDGK